MADEFRAALKTAGLTGFTPYSMGHTFAALRLSTGAKPKWVSQQLGHGDVTTTHRHYDEFFPKKGETSADILDTGILKPDTPDSAIPEPEMQTRSDAGPDWDLELAGLTGKTAGAGGGS